MWITKSEYDESGPTVVHRKCIGGLGQASVNVSSIEASSQQFVPPPRVGSINKDEHFNCESTAVANDSVSDETGKERVSNVVATCELADTNALLIRCGKAIARSSNGGVSLAGPVIQCSTCGAVPSKSSLESSCIQSKLNVIKFCIRDEILRIPFENISGNDFSFVTSKLVEQTGVNPSTLGYFDAKTGSWRRWNSATHETALCNALVGETLRLSVLSEDFEEPKYDVEDASNCILCEFCGTRGIHAPSDSMIPLLDGSEDHGTTFLLAPPPQADETDDVFVDQGSMPPMVIFCVDISASMSTSLKLESGGSMTRLNCVQTAVSQQLVSLRQNFPDCIVVIVSFGADVCVYTDGGNRSLIARKAHSSEADLISKGQDLSLICCEQLGDVAERLAATVANLKPSGNTALGPALAVSVGLASGRAGSKIVLCTDGMANNGVGSIQDRKQVVDFYADIGRRAAEEGTCISVITMEGEDCSMENLGTCADLTGGQVEMVDLQALSTNVGAILANATLATNLEMTVIAAGGIHLDMACPHFEKGFACVSTLLIGNASNKTDLSFDLKITADLMKHVGKSLPFQVQLRYTRPDGGKVLQVLRVDQHISSDRDAAEHDINGVCIGLRGIHSAARLAQQGEYRAARVQLILTCRLLQRAMRTPAHQESYLSFIVQAEKLDGFMREREAQDKIFGIENNSQRCRDDDASRSMYQMKNLSVNELTSRAS
jgi:hypothetical protein